MPTAAGAAETSATSGPDMLIPTQPESDSLSTVTPQPSGPIIPDDPPLTIPSEWNDAEVQSEKWATKQTFEDPDGPIRLPPTAVLLADWAAIKVEYRRPVDFLGAEAPVMVQPVAVQEELFRSPALGGDERQRPGAVRGGVATAAGSPGSRAASARQLAGGNASARASADVGAVQQEAGEAQQDAGDAQVEADVNGAEAIAAVADAATGEALPEGPLEASSKDANRTVEAHHVPAANNWTSFSKYIQHNQHLMASPLYRHLILYFQATFEQGKLCKAAGSQNPTDEFTPWEHIYPKGKDGLPVYNPSGKYYVRLHWMGAWRKVVIDDRIPFAGGKPLLLSSPVTNELWPLLLTKALLKLAVFRWVLYVASGYNDILLANSLCKPCISTFSYNYVDHAQEYGDFNALRCISGWLVEPITLSANPSAAFIGTLVNLSSRILSIPTPQQAGTPAETSHATLPTGKVAPITKSPSKERVNNGGLSLRDSVSIYAIGNGGEDSTAVMTYASWPHRVMEMVEDEGALFVRVRSVFQPDGHNVSDPWISYADFVKSFRYAAGIL